MVTASFASGVFADFSKLPIGQGVNIFVNNKSAEAVKFKMFELDDPKSTVTASLELPGKNISIIRQKHMVGKYIEIQDLNDQLIRYCWWSSNIPHKQGNVIEINIETTSNGTNCNNKGYGTVGKNLPISTQNTIVYQGTNFKISNNTNRIEKYSILEHDRVIGFVNVPSASNVQIALNLQDSYTLNNIRYGFGNLNQISLADPGCYRSLSTDKNVNVYSLVFYKANPEFCTGSRETMHISNGPHCIRSAVPGVDWTGCDKTKNSENPFKFTEQTDIHGADLEGAKFDSTIQGKNLQGVNFKSVNFSEYAIVGHRMWWNAPIGNFDKSNFSNAKFNNAHLVGFLANLSFESVDFRISKINGIAWGSSPGRTDFYRSSFTHSDMRGVNWSNVLARETKFNHTKLESANFSHAFLHYAKFDHVTAEDAQFNHADLSDTIFASSNLWDANFSNASMKSANFTSLNLNKANFTNALLINTVFTNVNASNSNFTNAKLTNKIEAYRSKFNHANFDGVTFDGVGLFSSEFNNASFKSIILSQNVIYPNTFAGSKFQGAFLEDFIIGDIYRGHWGTEPESIRLRVKLKNADFRCATIKDLKVYDERHRTIANLSEAQIVKLLKDEGVNYAGARINGSIPLNGRCIDGRPTE